VEVALAKVADFLDVTAACPHCRRRRAIDNHALRLAKQPVRWGVHRICRTYFNTASGLNIKIVCCQLQKASTLRRVG
jgi:hypothetical protein